MDALRSPLQALAAAADTCLYVPRTGVRSTRPAPGSLPVYDGRFGAGQAERLLWRAGFGPRPGEAAALARRGLRGAVLSLTRPGSHALAGPSPRLQSGQPIAPYDAWGNDVLWWLDRMVRSQAPLVERMTLNWHDWFATSNEGVNSQRLMINQNRTQRRLCLASFPAMLTAMTTDPAMALWLSLSGSTKTAPNENYARELQELFTLGVGDGYTERDVREHARALTGWTNGWNDATGQPDDFHFDPSLHDDGIKVIYGRRGRFGWRDSLKLVLGRPGHARFFVTKLWSYFSPAPLPQADERAAAQLYLASGKRIRPLVEAMLMHPLVYAGPRMVKPPIVQIAGMLRATGRFIDSDAWAWESSLVGQMPFYPPNVAGWDYTRWLNTDTWSARFNLTAQVIKPASVEEPGKAKLSSDPRELTRQAIAFWARRSSAARQEQLCARTPAPRSPPPRPTGSASSTRRSRSTPCARSSSRAPTTTPAEMPDRSCACHGFTRAQALARGVAQAGRGLPGIEPGMPAPAGTGLSRRGFLLSAAGVALSVYGAGRMLDPQAFEEGIAKAAAAGPTPVLVSVYLQGGIDSMSVLYPAADPLYSQYRTDLAIAAAAGTPFTEDPSLIWHPLAAPLAQLHGEGKVSVMPTVGYSDPNQSHFTSRHYWEVGATNADLMTGWLGRYLDLTGSAGNPLQGLSLDDSLSLALATARLPVATIDLPSTYSFWAQGVWGPPQDLMYDAFGALGRVGVRSRDLGMAQSGQAALMSNTLRTQLLPFQPAPGASAPPLPAGYPSASDSFPARMAAIAQMIAAGLPMSCVSVSTDSVFDTHENQAAPFAAGLGEVMQTLYAFQRDLEARAIDARVLTLVWSEFGRRPQQNASAGTDHGAAGCAFVMGSRAAGTMIGEWAGLASGLDPLGNLKQTADFRALYCALVEQWFGHDATPIIPGAAALTRPRVVA